MAPQAFHLPDGQTFTVTPVFAGLFFKSHDLNTHPGAFPIGWTVVLHTEDDSDNPGRRVSESSIGGGDEDDDSDKGDGGGDGEGDDADSGSHDDGAGRGGGTAPAVAGAVPAYANPERQAQRRSHLQSFTRPTLQNDSLFISSISNPSSTEFKPPASPTRQMAMMLWVTLYWYFHQPAPSPVLPPTAASAGTPDDARPRGEWRINIKRDGVLKARNLIPKLERMGLIASLDCAVGTGLDDNSHGWDRMFVSRRMFWQIPGRLFLFTLKPTGRSGSPFPGSPTDSRPTSPSHNSTGSNTNSAALLCDVPGAPPPMVPTSAPSFPISPFFSTSHLPTYYPPAPLQYTMTDGVRHPVRPKPPRAGEVFYTRFVPSVGRYLSLRVASASPQPVPYLGPLGPNPPEPQGSRLGALSDTGLLQRWLSNSRVSRFWGGFTPSFLPSALSAQHSFPAIGMWDGVPFGYFEIYWVKEDALGRHVGTDDWERGFHVLIGEEWARGRVQTWLTSLVHWAMCADMRTMSVCLEPRVDNKRFIRHLQDAGFAKAGEVSFPHKQSWFGRLKRENWEGPAL